ncbi:MAG: HepT-like ribonuclease domain-containing protein [Propionicimonas sp.]|nr:HepT-like ribonuclease domain-containing protein [Propionicimonas sp.]MEA5116202.1 HepT-like ribonuclease domain-containing protein [Propionicimonas sp.]
MLRAPEIAETGRDAYNDDPLRQEAGGSLMMKIGEAANRLDRAGAAPPAGVKWFDAVANRNWLVHQYDQIDRDITWATLKQDLATWRNALASSFSGSERPSPQRLAKPDDQHVGTAPRSPRPPQLNRRDDDWPSALSGLTPMARAPDAPLREFRCTKRMPPPTRCRARPPAGRTRHGFG